MMSSRRDGSVARTACGTLAGMRTIVAGCRPNLLSADRQDERTLEHDDQRVERRRVFAQLLAGVEGEDGEVPAGGPGQDAARDALVGRVDEGLEQRTPLRAAVCWTWCGW